MVLEQLDICRPLKKIKPQTKPYLYKNNSGLITDLNVKL